MKLGVIGCGNMATAILKGLIKNNPFEKLILNIFDIDKNKTNNLKKYKYINICQTTDILLKSSDYILIAVKPQHFDSLFNSINIDDNTVIISIAAGKTIDNIQSYYKTQKKIVRIMPNTPALVNLCMSGISFKNNISELEKKNVLKIFNVLGKTLIVEENRIDAITAVSGSGPAYLFYFAEAFIESAMNLGFSKDESILLVNQTIKGSVELMLNSEDEPDILRKKVTSPGGTTEAAINNLEKENFKNILIKSIEKAKQRSIELKS